MLIAPNHPARSVPNARRPAWVAQRRGPDDDPKNDDDPSDRLAAPLVIPGVARGADPTVTMEASAFLPSDLTISTGDTVTWTNKDPAIHDAVDNGGAWRRRS